MYGQSHCRLSLLEPGNLNDEFTASLNGSIFDRSHRVVDWHCWELTHPKRDCSWNTERSAGSGRPIVNGSLHARLEPNVKLAHFFSELRELL